jgi:FkbM family methyltransferase|tara:strand:+ start:4978 stop:5529 length:552 start_codon:yes stop_codon:yes gene_type:complete
MKTFVEIGCCDFNTLRDLCDSGWRGIMVDPHKPYLDNISDHENLTKVNTAVGLYDGKTTFKRISDEYIKSVDDENYKGMGTITNVTTLDTSKILKDNLEIYEVPLTTFNTMLTSLGITTIDYLKIDTEGMDFDILKSIDYTKYNINIIRMEHTYCDDKLVIDFLNHNGYHCELFKNDIIAIKK